MAHRWDARQVLDFDTSNSFTCVGITKQGRRCRNPIAYANRQAASYTLDLLSSHDPLSQDTRDELEDLAFFSLCVRYHRMEATTPGHSQHKTVVRGWKQVIRDHVAERVEAERRRAARSARRNREVTARTNLMSEATALGRAYRTVPEMEAPEDSHRAISNPATPNRRVRAQPSTTRLITANMLQTPPPSTERIRRSALEMPPDETTFSDCSTAVGSPVIYPWSRERPSRGINENINPGPLLSPATPNRNVLINPFTHRPITTNMLQTPPPSTERIRPSAFETPPNETTFSGSSTAVGSPVISPSSSERLSRSFIENISPGPLLTILSSSERPSRNINENTNPESSLLPSPSSERSSRSFIENTNLRSSSLPPSSETPSRSFIKDDNPGPSLTYPSSSERLSQSFIEDNNPGPSLTPPSSSERPSRSFNEDINPGPSSSENSKKITSKGESLPLRIDGFENEIEEDDGDSERAEIHLRAIFEQTETQDKGKGKKVHNSLRTSNDFSATPKHMFEVAESSTKAPSSEITHMENLIALGATMMSVPLQTSNMISGRQNIVKIEDPFTSSQTGTVISNPPGSLFSLNSSIQPRRTSLIDVLNGSNYMVNKSQVEADNVIGSTNILLTPHKSPVPCSPSPKSVQVQRDNGNQSSLQPANGINDNEPIHASSITTHDASFPPQLSIERLEVSSISTDSSLARQQPESSSPESNAISYVNITSTTKHSVWRLSELQQSLNARPVETPPATEMVEHLSMGQGFHASLLLDMPKLEVRDTLVEIKVEDENNMMAGPIEKRRCRLWKKLSRISGKVVCMRLRRKPSATDED